MFRKLFQSRREPEPFIQNIIEADLTFLKGDPQLAKQEYFKVQESHPSPFLWARIIRAHAYDARKAGRVVEQIGPLDRWSTAALMHANKADRERVHSETVSSLSFAASLMLHNALDFENEDRDSDEAVFERKVRLIIIQHFITTTLERFHSASKTSVQLITKYLPTEAQKGSLANTPWPETPQLPDLTPADFYAQKPIGDELRESSFIEDSILRIELADQLIEIGQIDQADRLYLNVSEHLISPFLSSRIIRAKAAKSHCEFRLLIRLIPMLERFLKQPFGKGMPKPNESAQTDLLDAVGFYSYKSIIAAEKEGCLDDGPEAIESDLNVLLAWVRFAANICPEAESKVHTQVNSIVSHMRSHSANSTLPQFTLHFSPVSSNQCALVD